MKKTLIAILGLCAIALNAADTASSKDLSEKMHALAVETAGRHEAREVMIAVMDSETGDVISLIDHTDPASGIDRKRAGFSPLQYTFEPGSVMKTIVYALLIDKGRVHPYDVMNAHQGTYEISGKMITDKHKFDYISAENAIVHSSNVVMAQMAQRLEGDEFHNGLKAFGFTQPSSISIKKEHTGVIPSSTHLSTETYKAVVSYGYGFRVNLMQLMRAYSAFNNDGKMIRPKIPLRAYDNYTIERSDVLFEKSVPVINRSAAELVKAALIKCVETGTGNLAMTPGLEIGGKTGTACIAENGRFVEKYHSSFVGFANDPEHRYMIGVLIVEPKIDYYASISAVPLFKKVVDAMVDEKLLTSQATLDGFTRDRRVELQQ